jgi:hypothetical protein
MSRFGSHFDALAMVSTRNGVKLMYGLAKLQKLLQNPPYLSGMIGATRTTFRSGVQCRHSKSVRKLNLERHVRHRI